MSEITPEDKILINCLASIVFGLKINEYKDPHLTEFRNPQNGGVVILAQSPDGKTHFAIEVRTWDPHKEVIQ